MSRNVRKLRSMLLYVRGFSYTSYYIDLAVLLTILANRLLAVTGVSYGNESIAGMNYLSRELISHPQ